jgi:predicted MFS family arabinose efflux permease
VALVAFVGFVIAEHRAERPLLDLGWFRRPEFTGANAGATEALGPDRAGIASAVNNTSRQVGGAIGVALIGGLASISTSLIFSAAALLLGGTLALALMGRVAPSSRPVGGRRHGLSSARR